MATKTAKQQYDEVKARYDAKDATITPDVLEHYRRQMVEEQQLADSKKAAAE